MSEQAALEYTLPGVLHFLQAEWRRFERERNEWTIERAELKARIALLEGERKGVENSRLILMKRVKMLEYALRQERKRYSDKEENTDTRATTVPMIRNTPASSLEESSKDDNDTNIKLREKSKQLLKSCLEEINYLTTIPTKLPLTNVLASTIDQTKFVRTDSPLPKGQSNQRTQKARRQAVQQSSVSPSPKEVPSPPKEELEELEVPANVDEVAMMNNMSRSPDNNKEMSAEIQEKFNVSEDKVMKLMKNASKGTSSSKDSLLGDDLDSYQLREAMDDHPQNQQKIWKTRVTIKGHLDSVRAVYFHPKEMIAASGSDDGTVKIWNLKKVTGKDGNAGKKGSFEEADPSITFRGHTNIVTSLAISSLQNRVFSASLDSTIRVWKLPSEEWGPFSPVDPSLSLATYVGHTDAIWDLKLSPHGDLLASASADRTVKIWDTQSSGSLLKSTWTIDGILSSGETQRDKVAPTSLDFCQHDIGKLAISFANAKINVYDIEKGQVAVSLKKSDETYDNTRATQVNRIVTHATMPLLISGHEDRHIKVFDTRTGECINTLSGHLDAVTSLDIDPTNDTLVSGGHDSAIRIWNLDSFTNVQEFSAHRRKGNEGVLGVNFHRSYPWMISGGADGIIKVYHYGH
ncbi:hypothetical protein G6F70_001730 [Rhizopus microsporus]|uniref:Striatin N-terminal domain-containing protein n=2 Tax=Rhizopus TaxID=4842 RepID=A0A367JHF5_RHIAZ|nr:hypothetical protein G6F71_004285 [Rhizopus microsporus]RCH89357.1 hypothetical protein CU097_003551 [Rhizopus azygosporus]KAG1203050.1 hypothetical protein G6F70_001730 [Rhizopus microsporus]KAG1211864.1 hypothetical protein G6F69_004226 [Rhizopus microsporus]KAG1237252.1 hypothetical protein G6F67_001352 [Rhizopus microsporus]